MGKVKDWKQLLTNTTRIPKKRRECFDGPWAGQTLCVSTLPTATLQIRGEMGRYVLKDGMAVWEIQTNENSRQPDPAPGTTGNR